jgi:hypothetical protein
MNDQIVNPLLTGIKLPGRTFQLPSRGVLYNNGELDHNITNGEIHVHPLTALTEINLKNPDLLFNGKALISVVQECIPGINKPLELFGRDVDALLFFLRVVTYGPEYRIEVKHNCQNAKNHSYVINLEELLINIKQLDPTITDAKRIITMPLTGQKIYVRPMRFADIVTLFHSSEGKKELTSDDIKELAIINLKSMIERVDEVTNPTFIEPWIRTLTTPQINRITNAATTLNDWGPQQIVTVKCKDCGEEMQVELPMNPVSFFTE